MPDRTYRLLVEGELSDQLGLAFPGMVLTRDAGSTALTGTVRDQSELHGHLRRASDLGLTLLEARALDDGSDHRLTPTRTGDSPSARRPD
jgi:hypothetical protein